MRKPQAVREFLSLVESACPLAELAVDHADKPDGDWWIDARANGELITVFWASKSGFGFSTQDPIGYGEKPNEVYASAAMAATRFVQLMERAGTGRTLSLGIAELRELFGLSQTELAKRVGVEQAAISRVEGRENIEINTLRSLVEALGMRLSVQVFAPGISANVEPGKGREKLPKAAKTRVKAIYGKVAFAGGHIPSVTYENENPEYVLIRKRYAGFAVVRKAAAKPNAACKDKPAIKAFKPRRSRSAAPGKSQGQTK